MARQFIDLSITLCNEVVSDPPFMRPHITYQTHGETVTEAAHFFPGLTAEAIPGGEGFAAAETITLTTHNGTHLDAPWHFHPTMNGGERAITIDEVPLEWCFQPGVKLDFRHFPDGYVVTAQDVENELAVTPCNHSKSCWSTPPRARHWVAPTLSVSAAAWAMRRPSTSPAGASA